MIVHDKTRLIGSLRFFYEYDRNGGIYSPHPWPAQKNRDPGASGVFVAPVLLLQRPDSYAFPHACENSAKPIWNSLATIAILAKVRMTYLCREKVMTCRRIARRSLMLTVLSVAAVLSVVADESPKESTKSATIQALQEFNVLIGGWRGVGQPKRGSQAGAWQERAESLWELKPDSHGIRWNVEAGKQWTSALLGYDEGQKLYTLTSTLGDKSTRTYRGKIDEKRLVMESDADDEKDVHRVTLTVLGENRVTVLMEKRPAQQSFFTRVAEIGYQRDGTRLAVAGTSGPECVVTGGLGTIMVSFKGKSYYVCCTGCRDAFNDDPEGILADYKKRKAAEKDKKH